MTDNVIKVENLSKKYILRHERGGRSRYVALRDVVADKVASLFRPGQDSEASREEFLALKDVSFTIKQGESVGIIGRNGAGKSTLLKILSRITEPSSGRIEIEGRVASLLEVGTGFHPELTGRENIFLNGAILGMKRAEIRKRFDEIVAFAEVEKFLDTPVKHFSSGMYMRLAFAVAAHLESEILIVDEVLAVGDIEFQKKCFGKMNDVAKGGRTVLFVSHNMAGVSALCKTGIYLKSGSIDFAGPVDEVVNRYFNDGIDESGEKIWKDLAKAPGNELIRITEVRVISEGKTSGSVDISNEAIIEVVYKTLVPNLRICVSIHLIDQYGGVILASLNTPSSSLKQDDWFNQTYPQGGFSSRCTLPANFLNEGKYRISAFVLRGTNSIEAVALEAISFDVAESGSMRKEYIGPWIGAIRPRLDWQTKQLSHAEKQGGLRTIQERTC